MSQFYDQVKERFIRYAKVDTQSQNGAATVPSTEKQWDLAHMLEEEMKNIGLQNVTHDDFCNVYGTIPSTLPNGVFPPQVDGTPPFFSASLATPTREKGRQADEAEGRKVIFP